MACDFIFFGGWKNSPPVVAAAVASPSAAPNPPVTSNTPIARAPVNVEKDIALSRYNVRLLSRLEIPVEQLKNIKALPVIHRGLPSDHIALAARFGFERNLR